MAKDMNRLKKIYQKTDGYCHICHKKLALTNHGKHGARGAWHIEHSIPKSKGGTDHLNNLFPACISCNLEKGTVHTRTARTRNGATRSPYNKKKKEQIKQNNTATGAVIGGTIGAFGGPVGIVIGAVLGGTIGNSNSPKK